MVEEAVRKSAILVEALPYIRAFSGKVVVIKLGGSAQDDPGILRNIFVDIQFMLSVGMRPVVVYGGGKRISAAMETAGLTPNFVYGQRVTDAPSMEIVSRVLVDEVGRDLLGILERDGGRGSLLNGRDHGFLRAIPKRLPVHPDVDLGFVGDPVAIDAAQCYALQEEGVVPLVAPVACGCADDCKTLYNINGDTASALIARDLHALKLVFLTDTPGVYRDAADPSTLLPHLSEEEARALIGDGTIAGGMIPKVEACLFGLDGGVGKAHIVSGSQPHALLLEIFTEQGVGTELVI